MHIRNTRALIGVVSILAALGVFGLMKTDAFNAEPRSPAVELEPDQLAVVSQGAVIYQQYCAVCHGKNLEGQRNWRQRDQSGRLPAPPHDETGHTWHHPDQMLFTILKDGITSLIDDPNYATNMPVYGDILSDQEIVAVLSYIESTWPESIRNQRATARE